MRLTLDIYVMYAWPENRASCYQSCCCAAVYCAYCVCWEQPTRHLLDRNPEKYTILYMYLVFWTFSFVILMLIDMFVPPIGWWGSRAGPRPSCWRSSCSILRWPASTQQRSGFRPTSNNPAHCSCYEEPENKVVYCTSLLSTNAMATIPPQVYCRRLILRGSQAQGRQQTAQCCKSAGLTHGIMGSPEPN